MSSGTFTISRYGADYAAAIHPIKVQPETLTAVVGGVTNNPPAGAINAPISAGVNLTNRQIGLHPRKVIIQFPATGQPANYKPSGVTKIPALTTAFYNAATKGATITYLGVACTVLNRLPERTV